MAGMNELIGRLQRLESGEVFQRIGTRVANACHAAAITGFIAERDPYGRSWARRVRKGDGHPVLRNTGALVGSLTSRYIPGTGTVVMRALGYGKFHQYGTRRMPARKIFPDPAEGLGLWADPVQRAATEAVRELLR
jgi:phage gpG-like protein